VRRSGAALASCRLIARHLYPGQRCRNTPASGFAPWKCGPPNFNPALPPNAAPMSRPNALHALRWPTPATPGCTAAAGLSCKEALVAAFGIRQAQVITSYLKHHTIAHTRQRRIWPCRHAGFPALFPATPHTTQPPTPCTLTSRPAVADVETSADALHRRARSKRSPRGLRSDLWWLYGSYPPYIAIHGRTRGPLHGHHLRSLPLGTAASNAAPRGFVSASHALW
jgi:hypothetical protein